MKLKDLDWKSIWLVFVVCVSVSMVVAAMAALNTALPSISKDAQIKPNVSELTWIIDGYTLVLAALLLPAGAIGDRLGRRGVMIAGLVGFGVASLLGVYADTAVQLIATRALAGAAAAFIMPTTLSLITSNLPERQRPLAISVWAAVSSSGAIGGFFVSGYLLKYFHWHSILLTFAVAAAVTAVLCLSVGTSKDPSPDPFDWIGSAASIAAILAFVFGLLEAPQRGWDDALVIGSLVAGVVLAVAFCLIEVRSRYPLLDVTLFTNRAFGAGSLSVTLQFFAAFAAFFLIIQQLQFIFDYTPLAAAVAMFPMLIASGLFSLLGNWVAVRFHSLRFVVAAGVFLAGLGILLIGLVDYHDYWVLAIFMAIAATGIGLAAAPSTTAIMQNTPLDDQGVGSAVNDTARELGAAIGVALAGSILAAGYKSRIAATADTAQHALANPALGGNPEKAAQAADAIRRNIGGATEVVGPLLDEKAPPPARQLGTQILDGAQAAFNQPLHTASLILGAILIAASLFLVWFAPRRMVEEADAPA
ncbi:MAG: MFS transporter [Gordonia sp. (in: high G+C Gram-positive bacteria)]|uniref:MFS transporter n=1 Tax=Gordonia sp. (in: high G+C Gram-positive bacteria) TaxID=84139 RepID=UPI0039E458D9